jgi:hypothetical protein
LRGRNAKALIALGLTGQKTFIYGIPDKIFGWLVALMLW